MLPPAMWLLVLAELALELAQGCHPRPPHLTTMRSIWVVVDGHLTLVVQVPSVLLLPLVVVRERMRLLAELPLLAPLPPPLPLSQRQPQCSGCCHRECRHGAFLEAMPQMLRCCQCRRAQVEQQHSWQPWLLHAPPQLQAKSLVLRSLVVEAAASLRGNPHIPLEQLQRELQQQAPLWYFLW